MFGVGRGDANPEEFNKCPLPQSESLQSGLELDICISDSNFRKHSFHQQTLTLVYKVKVVWRSIVLSLRRDWEQWCQFYHYQSSTMKIFPFMDCLHSSLRVSENEQFKFYRISVLWLHFHRNSEDRRLKPQ